MSDELLMRQYQEGNEDAFNRLYAKYSSLVYAYAKKRLRGHDVDDFYQQVWRQLHEKRSLYQHQPFAPWFFVLIRNLLIDEYRSRSRKPVEFQDELLEKLHGKDDPTGEVEELLELLPPDTRALVRQYYLEGVSYEELEKNTGLSQTNLRQRLSRTIKGLREKVRGE